MNWNTNEGATKKRYKRSHITTRHVLVASYYNNLSDCSYFSNIIECKFKGYPLKVIYSAVERDISNGVMECGISLRSPYITEKGFIEALKYGVEIPDQLKKELNGSEYTLDKYQDFYVKYRLKDLTTDIIVDKLLNF